MRDYRYVKFSNGEGVFCIVEHETSDTLVVVFPMLVKEHTFSVGPSSVRETYSASQLCPFTDDKSFNFRKSEVSFTKPLSKEAIPYYHTLLNRNEEVDVLQKYNLHDIIEEEEDFVVEIQDEEEPSVVDGNSTIH